MSDTVRKTLGYFSVVAIPFDQNQPVLCICNEVDHNFFC